MPRTATQAGTDVGRFRPRARLLTTLGAELISNEVVAVIELVRNAYDADASLVEIEFSNVVEADEASLTIRDDGHGMSRDVLLGPWLEPATDYKAASSSLAGGGVVSPKGRRRLGSKGVGRFASQRLGAHLVVHTKTADQKRALAAEFDWRDFESEDSYLDELRIPWSHVKPDVEPSGTELRITQLRDHWDAYRLERLHLGLSRLISPKFGRDRFRIRLVADGIAESIKPSIEKIPAMYSIAGKVLDGGACEISYEDISGSHEEWQRTVIWPNGQTSGSFEFRINAWDLDRDALDHFFAATLYSVQGIREFRKILKEHSGVSLYRDGFRILPYGEPDNDWLRLDRRRVNNPTLRLSNNQVLGWLKLTADRNEDLKDQTNREGLVANEAYDHLRHVVEELLQYLENRRFSARRSFLKSKAKSTQLPLISIDRRDRVQEMLSALKGANGNSQSAIDQVMGQFQEHEKEAAEAVKHYAGLAAAGQMSGLIFSQLKHPIRHLASDVRLALAEVEGGKLDPDDIEDLASSLRLMREQVNDLQSMIERFDPLAIGRREGGATTVELADVAESVVAAFRQRCNESGVRIEIQGRLDVRIRTSPSACRMALAAVLDNAIYWLAQSPPPQGKEPLVTIRIVKDGLIVMNNGPAIPASHRNEIFEPHFSTKPDAPGLGLTLSRDLLGAIGGRIQVEAIDPVRFRISLT